MASTSTNKQPMLIDRVLHTVVDLAGHTINKNAGIEIGGTNTAELVVDSTTGDGCILEDIYCYSRGTDYQIQMYLSSAADYLRPQQGIFVGSFSCGATAQGRVSWDSAPKILAPVPNTTIDDASAGIPQFNALYIPKGRALWAAVIEASDGDPANDAPLLGVQGGWY